MQFPEFDYVLGQITSLSSTRDMPGLVDLTHKVFNDTRPILTYAYLFSETEDNQDLSFQTARLIKERGLASKFLISTFPAFEGYTGYDQWRSRLSRLVGDEHIIAVPPLNEHSMNTYTESEAVVRFCQEHGIREIYVLAPAFHHLRAFISIVSATLKQELDLSIYSFPGYVGIWDLPVRHSQGTLKARRDELFVPEMDRIKRYTAQGDLIEPTKVLEYMHSRDQPQQPTYLK